jgi:hypothetical protein
MPNIVEIGPRDRGRVTEYLSTCNNGFKLSNVTLSQDVPNFKDLSVANTIKHTDAESSRMFTVTDGQKDS